MSEQNGPQPAGGQPGDPWAPPEHRPSLDKPSGVPQQGQPGVPPNRPLDAQPTVTDLGGAAPGPVPPPPPAPGPYGYPSQAPTPPPPAAGPYSGAGTPGYGFPQYPAGPAPYPGQGWNGAPAPANGMGTAALVLGIVSVVGFCLYGVVGIITGILAIVFGIKGRRKADNGEANNRGAATAGLIMGWIGAVIGLLVVAFIVVAIVIGVHDSKDTPFDDGDPFATSLVVDH
ncbi:DUF4190 domain-containing protein [Streptomyces fuscigenes]|uniref:DUF4190 domain-containing protein n=1 Tax=Streptomyces fuscigenes TaxID=1528880 RepID=UPI001F1741FF|nr:DUF4190 domain-containing protein [Streptomyces fuscigenes]MCF3962321.1 DUF4190 domain-containing protein [Streptomyces fuscigenes]